MVTFEYWQTVVQFRIPIDEKGNPGRAETTRAWTAQMGAQKKATKKETIEVTAKVNEDIEL